MRAVAPRPRRLSGRPGGGAGVAAGVRGRASAGRLPPAPAGRLRPRPVPDPGPTSSTSSSPRSRRSGRSSGSTTAPTSSRVSLAGCRARSPGAAPRRAAQRRQGLGLQVPARVLPTRERAQRGAAAPARGQPVRGGAPAPLQRAGRAESRPRALPERRPPLHGRAQEPAQRPGRPGRHPAVPGGPRPPRAALRLRALPRPLRGRPRAGVRDHLPRRAEDPLPALQPGALRRGGEPAGPAHAGRLPHRLPVGGGLGPPGASSIRSSW